MHGAPQCFSQRRFSGGRHIGGGDSARVVAPSPAFLNMGALGGSGHVPETRNMARKILAGDLRRLKAWRTGSNQVGQGWVKVRLSWYTTAEEMIGTHSALCPPCIDGVPLVQQLRKAEAWIRQCDASFWPERGTRPRPQKRRSRLSIGPDHAARKWLRDGGAMCDRDRERRRKKEGRREGVQGMRSMSWSSRGVYDDLGLDTSSRECRCGNCQLSRKAAGGSAGHGGRTGCCCCERVCCRGVRGTLSSGSRKFW